MRRTHSKYFYFSIALHAVLLILLIASIDFSSQTPVLENSNQSNQVINAMVMDTPPTPIKVAQKPVPPPPAPPQPIFPQPIKPKPDPKPQVVETKKPTIAIPDKKLQEEKISKQLLADLKKQVDQKKKIKQQKELAKAFEKEMKQLAAKALQQQMLQEQKRIAGARTQQMSGVVNKYKALILQSISQNWLVPSNVDKTLYAELMIRVAPGGSVMDVQVIKSSGDETLDRSARAAVLKSSPLPVPNDPDEFDPFRQFVLKVKPENILGGDTWVN